MYGLNSQITIDLPKSEIFLDTLILEEEMKKINGGISLSELTPHYPLGDESRFKEFVPYFISDMDSDEMHEERLTKLARKYEHITKPTSMIINSFEELKSHMINAYKVSHFHYILGKKYNLKQTFPNNCCGVSGRSVMLSLLEHGYPNTVYVGTSKGEHAYALMPFVFPEQNIKGSIIIDPTFDQLWNENKDIRNAVFIKKGEKWEYRTDWEDNENLFPDLILSVDRLKHVTKNFENEEEYHYNGKYYLEKAFSNPINVTPNPFLNQINIGYHQMTDEQISIYYPKKTEQPKLFERLMSIFLNYD